MTVVVVRVELPVELLTWNDAGKSKLAVEGCCRMCKRLSTVRPLTRHHLVPQSWCNRRRFIVGGLVIDRHRIRDADANIVPLCAPCHREVENEAAARGMLRKLLAAQEAAFVIKLRGERWFDTIYAPNHRHAPSRTLAA